MSKQGCYHSLFLPQTHSCLQIQHLLPQFFPSDFHILLLFLELCYSLLLFNQFVLSCLPLPFPFLPQRCYPLNQKLIEFLIALLVHVRQLRDAAPQHVQVLLNGLPLDLHRGYHLPQSLDVTADREVHTRLLLFLEHHSKINQHHRVMRPCIRRMLTLATNSRAHFGRSKKVFLRDQQPQWNRQEFLPKLAKEIEQAQPHLQGEHPEDVGYFSKRGWKIEYDASKHRYEYLKNTGHHEANIIVPVKSDPPNEPNNPHKSPVPAEHQNVEFAPVAVYLKKPSDSRQMVIELAVLQGGVQLMSVFFTELKDGKIDTKAKYPGPQLSTLPKQVTEAIKTLMDSLDISTEMIMNTVLHSANRVDEIDTLWLKNLLEMMS